MTSVDQLKALQAAIIKGDAYRLAQEDLAFLAEEDLRPLRLQLELLKPELRLRRHNIRSTVVIFGSARVVSPEDARARVDHLEAGLKEHPGDPELVSALGVARRQLAYSRYYDEARRFAQLMSSHFQCGGRSDLVVVTGGGPGIMEAANRGAFEVGAQSVGFNITLPQEQTPNPYITPDLAFRFHYFAMRKMHLLLRACALVIFPGGYGTLDELFEVLTLVQTGKVSRIPIILYGHDFWERAVDFDFLVQEGMIHAADAELFRIVETADEAIGIMREFYS